MDVKNKEISIIFFVKDITKKPSRGTNFYRTTIYVEDGVIHRRICAFSAYVDNVDQFQHVIEKKLIKEIRKIRI